MNRREIRSLIFHILYALENFDYAITPEAVIENFNRGFGLDVPPDGEATQVAKDVADRREEFDSLLIPFLEHWTLERLSLATRIILRMALAELLIQKNPHSIVINEAVELAKCFAEEDAYRFINGVLDKFVTEKKLKLPKAE